MKKITAKENQQRRDELNATLDAVKEQNDQARLEKLLAKLNAALINSDEIWKAGEKSHAYIIGYLQGAIKSAIIDIECMKH